MLLCILAITGSVLAQQPAYSNMLRVYEDNDIINITSKATDKGYTNGTRVDWFYTKNNRGKFLLHRIMPTAGDSSINTFGWGIAQIMITPNEIWKRNPPISDYPYAGAAYITHSLYATNPIKKYNIQTEWLLGVMGPPALAGETQKLVHRWVSYIQPQGWDHQLKADPLLNLSMAGEKQLWHIHNGLEVIGGAQVYAGTAMNGASLYSIIRFGKMEPYFNGFLTQFTRKQGARNNWQLYFIVRPGVDWMLTNALLDGGIFNHRHEAGREPVYDPNDTTGAYTTPMVRERVVARINYGIVVAWGPIGISFTETSLTPAIKSGGPQDIGNVTVHVAW